MNITIDGIKANLQDVHIKIARAASLSGRQAQEIKLVVVSKSQPLEIIRDAIDAGVRLFGENYPEEAVEKIKYLNIINLEWHMIGHLQSRKVMLMIRNFSYFHALDSMHLAEKVNNALSEQEKVLPVLIEVNISGEESKFGWRLETDEQWDRLLEDVEKLSELKYLSIHGLMTMPPYSEDPESSRNYFKRLRQLQDKLSCRFPYMNWKELSMGTSVDYEVAIQEGSTFVRIGQAILGPRIYQV